MPPTGHQVTALTTILATTTLATTTLAIPPSTLDRAWGRVVVVGVEPTDVVGLGLSLGLDRRVALLGLLSLTCRLNDTPFSAGGCELSVMGPYALISGIELDTGDD